jgi:hypothetical protein
MPGYEEILEPNHANRRATYNRTMLALQRDSSAPSSKVAAIVEALPICPWALPYSHTQDVID